MLSSRERIHLALNHQNADRTPIDLGASPVTGMHASSVYRLRQAFKLDPPGTPVKVIDPYQMRGEIALDLLNAVGGDVLPLSGTNNFFGFRNEGWKPWTFHDGTPLLVPEKFNTNPEPDGSIYAYPEGDIRMPPSGKMPAGGWYFDSIVRQPPIDEEHLDIQDNLEEFGPISDAELLHFQQETERLYSTTDKAILGVFGGTSFGDIALVPAPQLRHPRGIRDIEEWYVSTVSRRDYVYAVFEKQCEIALANLEKIFAAVGDKVDIIYVSGTDFGAQSGSFVSPRAYRSLFKPFHIEVNRWVHTHTPWKTFIHSCGSVYNLIEDFIDAGFDILNPVQVTAANMDPAQLKSKFGDRVTFWGGGVDTQKVLPFGTPEEVRSQVRERMHIFGRSGGFVFNPIHNVQPLTPPENLIAMYQTVLGGE